MDWTVAVTALIASLLGSGATGGAIAAYFKFRTNQQAVKYEQQEVLFKQIMENANRATARVDILLNELAKRDEAITERNTKIGQLQNEVHALSEKVDRLRKQIKQMESNRIAYDTMHVVEGMMDTFPFPAWLHSVGENKWYVNDAYCKAFGIHRDTFWQGVNILAMYPAEIAAKYVQHDMKVVESNMGSLFTEQVSKNVMQHDPQSEFECDIYKMPIVAGGKRYIFGLAKLGHDVWGNKLATISD
ncbi:MAG: hypothetical protein CL489_06080 [Acidobacteria bacterium]|nr:hypothetical protein [Acidobacteriota bacterium]|tara:strand:+ start:7358 stop:8092 length:735 start_codon:yes stop_codon:yes gene_type:complete